MGNKSKFSSSPSTTTTTNPVNKQPLDYRPSSGSGSNNQQQPLATTSNRSSQLPVGADTTDAIKITSNETTFERENPSKITHGFWLQQYSWLHNDNSKGTASGCDTSGFHTQIECGSKSVPLRARQPASRRQRLLNRWNNLMRTFGGSQSENLEQHQQQTGTGSAYSQQGLKVQQNQNQGEASGGGQQHHLSSSSSSSSTKRSMHNNNKPERISKSTSPSRWRPQSVFGASSKLETTAQETSSRLYPGEVTTTNKVGASGGGGKESLRKRGRWFMKSLSSSTSALMSSSQQQHSHSKLEDTSSQLVSDEQAFACFPQLDSSTFEPLDGAQGSCQVTPPISVQKQQQQQQYQKLPASGTNKLPASPYRQIVKVLASKSPTHRRRRKQQQKEKENVTDFNGDKDKLPVSSGDSLRGESLQATSGGKETPSESAHVGGLKKSRLMQFAFSTCSSGHKHQQHQQDVLRSSSQGGSKHLLGNIFVSPLFRRSENTLAVSSTHPPKGFSSDQLALGAEEAQHQMEQREQKLIVGDKKRETVKIGFSSCATTTRSADTETEAAPKTPKAPKGEIRAEVVANCIGQAFSKSNSHSHSHSGKGGATDDVDGQLLNRSSGAVGELPVGEATSCSDDVDHDGGRKNLSGAQKDHNRDSLTFGATNKSEKTSEREFSRQATEVDFERDFVVAESSSDLGKSYATAAAVVPNSSEFKFQVASNASGKGEEEEGNYYANETKVVETATSNLTFDQQSKLISTSSSREANIQENADKDEEKFVYRTEAEEAKFDKLPRENKRVLSKRVKVSHESCYLDHLNGSSRNSFQSKFEDDVKSGQNSKIDSRVSINYENFVQDSCDQQEMEPPTSGQANQPPAQLKQEPEVGGQQQQQQLRFCAVEELYNERSLLPLIQPLASSSSSISSICFDNSHTSQQTHGMELLLDSGEDHSGAEECFVHQRINQQADRRSENQKSIQLPVGGRNTCPREPPERPASQPAATTTASSLLQQTAGTSKQKVVGVQAPTSSGGGVGLLRTNFKKLVKRQQSVDSYRMARDLKNKLKRQHEVRNKHQSNEAIKTKSVGDDGHLLDAASRQHRKFSISGGQAVDPTTTSVATSEVTTATGQPVKLTICIDPYAKPGSFTLPGEDRMTDEESTAAINKISASNRKDKLPRIVNPTPPNTLSLMMPQSTAAGAFIVGSFSGCITPTYPTHHLPSPKYAPPASSKKYSNASTISSSLGADISLGASNSSQYLRNREQQQQQQQQQQQLVDQYQTGSQNNQSDTESSLGAGGTTPSTMIITSANAQNRPSLVGGSSLAAGSGLINLGQSNDFGQANMMSMMMSNSRAVSNSATALIQTIQDEQMLAQAQMAAARRAQLAEHIYDNKCGLGEDMKFLASLPELCDITFLVGETREPVCAVKSVLAARSRVFHKILFGNRQNRRLIARQQQQEELENNHQQHRQHKPEADLRRGSSPKQPKIPLSTKSSSPMGARSTSPGTGSQQQQQHQWSVTADASGYNPSSVSPTNNNDESSGRHSVTSNGGRESGISHNSSQGSQQPLIIGPGQMAAPAPISGKRNKKSSVKDGVNSSSGGGGGHHSGSRLSRMFMKRASDPSIKQHQFGLPASGTGAGGGGGAGGVSGTNSTTQNYLDKMSLSQTSTTMIIEEFEPDVFRQLIEYIHTGCVLLQARTLLGLLNAADYYGLEQLRKACLRFVSCCITVDTVCSLLSTAERYIQYKCTKSIVQKVLEFVDTHADEIFKLNAFGLLPEHVVRLILSRDGLKADEHVKYNGVYTWCEHYCRSYELTNISDVMRNFIDLIQFHKIPTNVLLSEIYPTHIVPDNIFLSALAYQADPQNFEPQPMQTRRMTLPNPTYIYGKQTQYTDNGGDNTSQLEANGDNQSNTDSASIKQVVAASRASIENQENQMEFLAQDDKSARKRKSSDNSAATKQQDSSTSTKLASYGSHQALGARGAVRSRKSTGGQPESHNLNQQQQQQQVTGSSSRASKLRKGSIAQVSISGVMRKLSIKKRSSNLQQQQVSASGSAKNRRRIGSLASSSSNVLPSSGDRAAHKRLVSKQQSAIDGSQKDPMQLGKQILSAYLEQQRLRELEEEERKRKEELDRLEAEKAKRQSEQGGELPVTLNITATTSTTTNTTTNTSGILDQQQESDQTKQQKQTNIVKSSSTRKSFKDFKNISRRIFMRHSSSKMLQQQNSSTSSSTNQPISQQQQQQQGEKDSAKGEKAKRRNVLKIKRSETVFETTTSPSGS